MTTLTDTYGHTVAQSEDGTWNRDGCIVGPCDADTARTVFDGMAPAGWSPPVAPVLVPTTIAPLAFMARLTSAEQMAITTAGLQSPQIMLFLLKLVAPGEVDLTDPLFTAGVRAMVGGGLLTADRAAQISNLAVASP